MNALYAGHTLSTPPTVRWERGASFIWFPDGRPYYDLPLNAYCRFRRRFHLPPGATAGRMRLFADANYALWVNGTYVARGPCRADPRYSFYDQHDLAPLLRPGDENLIAVLVHFHSYDTGQSVARFPLLLADVTFEGGTAPICTDATWRCSMADAYDVDSPRMNGCQGQIEVFDARRDEPAWREVEFDDTAWPAAKVRALGRYNHPFWNLLQRPIPLLREEIIQSTGAVRQTTVVDRPEPAARLFHQLMSEQSGAWTDSPIPRNETGEVSIAATPAGTVAVRTFDFERVEVGYARLDVTGPAGAIIDVAYAETLIDGKVPAHHVSNRPFTRFVLAGGRNALEVAFGWRAFRYLRLTVRNAAGEVIVHSVGARTRRYPIDRIGSFNAADDVALDRIWDVSARTLEICAQDAFVDSPSREQQQWMGDGRWQAVFNYHLSGDPRLHAKLLDQIGQGQDCHGLTRSRYPDGHENYQPIPSFTLAWICSFADYWLYTGDLSPARRWWPNVLLALRWFDAHVSPGSGLLTDVPHWNFIDWSLPDIGDAPGLASTALNVQYLEALRCAARLATALGEPEAAANCADRAERLEAAIVNTAWDEVRGAYATVVGCADGGAAAGHALVPTPLSEAVNALALLHVHAAGEPRAARILQSVFAADATRLPDPGVLIGSPYFMTVVLRALAAHGQGDLAVSIVRERYGRLLAAGATSLWERWDVASHADPNGLNLDVTSASHGWGAAPLAIFSELILGIRPLRPGFERVRITPTLGTLRGASGRVPTPRGPIIIHLWRDGERVICNLLVPTGCIAVMVDGRELTSGAHEITLPLTPDLASGPVVPPTAERGVPGTAVET
ncbi:MAG TPA: family 78 glycoside hydrolase catalytic domain [Tepidisphaeraceae bacterium]|nr:family 78 glycoside hydrolase catalytic domain [Tepidisphaeraceae bacterium]